MGLLVHLSHDRISNFWQYYYFSFISYSLHFNGIAQFEDYYLHNVLTKTTIITSTPNGKNCAAIPPALKKRPLKNTKKHNLTMSQFLIPYALISIEFNAYATWEWQLSQQRLCIRVRYSVFASVMALSHCSAPPITSNQLVRLYCYHQQHAAPHNLITCAILPGKRVVSIRKALVGLPNA